MVWEVSGCQDPLQAVHQQGIDVHEMRMCKDGKNISADIRQVNTSSFRSTLNISDVLSNNTNLSVRCSKDDGSSEILIGMDELISTGMFALIIILLEVMKVTTSVWGESLPVIRKITLLA